MTDQSLFGAFVKGNGGIAAVRAAADSYLGERRFEHEHAPHSRYAIGNALTAIGEIVALTRAWLAKTPRLCAVFGGIRSWLGFLFGGSGK